MITTRTRAIIYYHYLTEFTHDHNDNAHDNSDSYEIEYDNDYKSSTPTNIVMDEYIREVFGDSFFVMLQ